MADERGEMRFERLYFSEKANKRHSAKRSRVGSGLAVLTGTGR